MYVLRTYYFSEGSPDLPATAIAAMDVGLQFIVENQLDDEGRVVFEARLMSDEVEVFPSDHRPWWAVPSGVTVTERLQPKPSDLSQALSDERWSTQVARAYWLWIADGDDHNDYEATAEWFVEFLDEPLEPDRNFRIFIPHEGDFDERGYLTERNRFELWHSLHNIASDLDSLCADWPDVTSLVRDDMPLSTQSQPLEWWRELRRSADRLTDAARRGQVGDLVPRTVGEEALIYLATRQDYVDFARDTIRDMERQAEFNALAVDEDDGELSEIPPDLTGDSDVAMLWARDQDGIDNQEERTNKLLGLGDLRPQTWHSLFDRALLALNMDRDEN
jgi:hypothetical protein